MKRKRFKHRVNIPFQSYSQQRFEIWDWCERVIGRIYHDGNPEGAWTAGFILNGKMDVYQFTFLDPKQAVFFKLTWS
jgi:hypothetical protein